MSLYVFIMFYELYLYNYIYIYLHIYGYIHAGPDQVGDSMLLS